MFILTKIADLVQIIPEDFGKDPAQAIEDNINTKYANKVIQKIGLCICLYDLLSASEGLIGHGSGVVNVNVEFRLVVFRPFKHEVMTGRISSATTTGIRIRTPFFDDIFVPASKLPEGSRFEVSEGLYVWETEGQSLFFDTQETVRFRIEDEVWHDQIPIGPRDKEDAGVVKSSPYQLIATMEDAGLGPCLWWDGDDGEGDEMES
ncbi:RNA polymerase III subunit Rpc25 [Mollisia scopiformis]|uniref:DNA-directed RNA polymerase subunit n=1 Tax=Mollisia scopiformis TaxID=149040 RepID=A0A194WT24_MOLSC|nr:RNA polymerase III subunit Rpc25 [Mollisia scopiformis]KUJ11108.1 RNA polymerase III subunit Rpc25 [Mollisia scopiformis]